MSGRRRFVRGRRRSGGGNGGNGGDDGGGGGSNGEDRVPDPAEYLSWADAAADVEDADSSAAGARPASDDAGGCGPDCPNCGGEGAAAAAAAYGGAAEMRSFLHGAIRDAAAAAGGVDALTEGIASQLFGSLVADHGIVLGANGMEQAFGHPGAFSYGLGYDTFGYFGGHYDDEDYDLAYDEDYDDDYGSDDDEIFLPGANFGGAGAAAAHAAGTPAAAQGPAAGVRESLLEIDAKNLAQSGAERPAPVSTIARTVLGARGVAAGRLPWGCGELASRWPPPAIELSGAGPGGEPDVLSLPPAPEAMDVVAAAGAGGVPPSAAPMLGTAFPAAVQRLVSRTVAPALGHAALRASYSGLVALERDGALPGPASAAAAATLLVMPPCAHRGGTLRFGCRRMAHEFDTDAPARAGRPSYVAYAADAAVTAASAPLRAGRRLAVRFDLVREAGDGDSRGFGEALDAEELAGALREWAASARAATGRGGPTGVLWAALPDGDQSGLEAGVREYALDMAEAPPGARPALALVDAALSLLPPGECVAAAGSVRVEKDGRVRDFDWLQPLRVSERTLHPLDALRTTVPGNPRPRDTLPFGWFAHAAQRTMADAHAHFCVVAFTAVGGRGARRSAKEERAAREFLAGTAAIRSLRAVLPQRAVRLCAVFLGFPPPVTATRPPNPQ